MLYLRMMQCVDDACIRVGGACRGIRSELALERLQCEVPHAWLCQSADRAGLHADT